MTEHAASLTVDLGALRANFRLLRARHAQGSIAAVVKANAYGLGVADVSRALLAEGCKMFFVATLAEGIELRGILPDAPIGVFGGLLAGEETEYQHHHLIPVINDLAQLDRFLARIPDMETPWLGILHIDTGMTRLGLSFTDLDSLPDAKRAFAADHLPLVMSHLACAGEPAHPKNDEQLTRFRAALVLMPGAQASLANSGGLFLDPSYHFQLGRPGCALYGINPHEGGNPMAAVATLSAPIVQVRTLDRDETVGYGATAAAARGSRIALCALGYADGWLRRNAGGYAYVAGQRVPLMGRVSMDTIALDVTSLPYHVLEDVRAEFLNDRQTVNDIAAQTDTIGYEILTSLGARIRRQYKDA